jgi:hypothetical protein
LTALGTVLPWAGGVYWGEPFGWTGWHLFYAHGPRFTAAIPPLVFALAAGAAAAFRRPRLIRFALGPGILLVGFVSFTYATYDVGHFGDVIRQYPGYTSSFLGVGFWFMVAGGLLITGAAVAAESATPDVVLRRSVRWLAFALLEFVLLWISPWNFLPVLLLGATVVAILGLIQRARLRSSQTPSAIDGPVGIPDMERLDSEPSDSLSESARRR